MKSHYRFLWKWIQFFRGQYFIATKRTLFVHTRRGKMIRIAFIVPQYQCDDWVCHSSAVGALHGVALGPGGFSPQETRFVVTTGICVTCPGLGVWGMCCTLTLVCKHSKRVQHVWLSWAACSQAPPLQGWGQLPNGCKSPLNTESPRVSAELWGLRRCSHWRCVGLHCGCTFPSRFPGFSTLNNSDCVRGCLCSWPFH